MSEVTPKKELPNGGSPDPIASTAEEASSETANGSVRTLVVPCTEEAPDPKMSLGDRMKSYEHTETVEPYLPFVVRADGKSFSKYTSGLLKPFDDQFQRAMVRTANSLLEFFSARTVFVCSDEISLVFDRVATREELANWPSETPRPVHNFNGRRFKIETLVAAKASVLFNKYMIEEVNNKETLDSHISDSPERYRPHVLAKIRDGQAIFDARLIVFPEGKESEIVNNLIWRSCYECHRNAVSTYARHLLGTKATFKKNSSEMIAMMREGKNGSSLEWETVPLSYRFGVFGKKELVTLTNEGGEEYIRGRVTNFSFDLRERTLEENFNMLFSKYHQK